MASQFTEINASFFGIFKWIATISDDDPIEFILNYERIITFGDLLLLSDEDICTLKATDPKTGFERTPPLMTRKKLQMFLIFCSNELTSRLDSQSDNEPIFGLWGAITPHAFALFCQSKGMLFSLAIPSTATAHQQPHLQQDKFNGMNLHSARDDDVDRNYNQATVDNTLVDTSIDSTTPNLLSSVICMFAASSMLKLTWKRSHGQFPEKSDSEVNPAKALSVLSSHCNAMTSRRQASQPVHLQPQFTAKDVIDKSLVHKNNRALIHGDFIPLDNDLSFNDQNDLPATVTNTYLAKGSFSGISLKSTCPFVLNYHIVVDDIDNACKPNDTGTLHTIIKKNLAVNLSTYDFFYQPTVLQAIDRKFVGHSNPNDNGERFKYKKKDFIKPICVCQEFKYLQSDTDDVQDVGE